MKTITIIMMMMSIIFPTLKHPLSMGLVVIITTIMISMMMNIMMKSSWYSYILFLIMLGGMLILFMYMASIASNEKMKFSIKYFWIIMITTLMIMNNEQLIMKKNLWIDLQKMQMMKMYLSNTMYITMFMGMYLMMTMIIIIYIINSNEGPMRKSS